MMIEEMVFNAYEEALASGKNFKDVAEAAGLKPQLTLSCHFAPILSAPASRSAMNSPSY